MNEFRQRPLCPECGRGKVAGRWADGNKVAFSCGTFIENEARRTTTGKQCRKIQKQVAREEAWEAQQRGET